MTVKSIANHMTEQEALPELLLPIYIRNTWGIRSCGNHWYLHNYCQLKQKHFGPISVK